MGVVIALFTIWFAVLTILLRGWQRVARSALPRGGGKDPLISVVVAARNEEDHIGTLLTALAAQDYGPFEVIVVDDGSDDNTVAVARGHTLPRLTVLASKGRGKKRALETGIHVAKGSIIVTTDADCTVPPTWLRSLRAAFRDKSVMLAFGGVRLEGESFFHALQAMEFSSLIGSGAATAALGAPVMCNGANLAFRRKVFFEVGGYQGNLHIPTGDDEFLMRKILRPYPSGVRFVSAPEAVVMTRPVASLNAFLHQRIRWASKWRFGKLAGQALAVLVVALQIAVLTNFALVFTPLVLQAFFLVAIKAVLEAAFLLQVCRFLGVRWRWRAFLALQVLYPVYVVSVAANALFTGYRWKDRSYEPV